MINSINLYPNNLKAIRLGNNLSLHKIAKLLHTTATQIKRLEEGQRTLTLDWAIRLSKELSCTPSDILGEKINDDESLYKIKRSISLIIPYHKNLNNFQEKNFEIVVDKEWIRLNYNVNDFDNLFLTDAPSNLLNMGIKKDELLLCYKTSTFIEGANIYLVNKNSLVRVKKITQNIKNQIIARVLAAIIKY